jgi:hypothetical protein
MSGSTANTINLNIDAADSLIGHKVTVYYDNTQKKDSDGNKYYNVYSIQDLSKEVSVFYKPWKTIYNNLGGSKMSIAAYDVYKTPADSFTYWLNNVDVTATTENASGTYGHNLTSTYTKTYIADLADNIPAETNLTLTGSFILDDSGVVIGYKATSYTVEKVSKITTTAGSESITLSFTGELSNNTISDVVVEYDGIAKGDYVNVVKSGNIYTLTRCTKVENVYISTYGNDLFNTINGTYLKSFSSKLTSDTIQVGGTYDIYLDYMGQYALVEEVEAANINLAFVAYIYFTSPSGSIGKFNYYAKCVDEEGIVADYLITPTTYTTLGGKIVSGAPTDPTAVTVNKLYTFKTSTDSTYYSKKTVAVLSDTGVKTAIQNLTSNYRIGESLTGASYFLATNVTYLYVNVGTNNNGSVPTTPTTPSSRIT